MPPRRTTRASAAPEERPAPAAPKRKRAVKTEPGQEPASDVEAPKPAPAARRTRATTTSKPSSRAKPSSRRVSGDSEEIPADPDVQGRPSPPKRIRKRSTLQDEEPPLAKALIKPASRTARGKKVVRSPTPPEDDSPDLDEASEDSEPEAPKTSKLSDEDLELSTPKPKKFVSVEAEPVNEENIKEETSSKGKPKVDDEEVEKSLLEDIDLAPPPEASSPPPPEEPQGPKSRLVIHKMSLINFKSYAGRQDIGPFHKSFSAIVGPNGSGKSNTIDALLFVFGYRASKMRQGKLSELIHNSANYPDLDDCSVEVHFREIIDLPGPDDFEDVPGSELIVARTAYKNNSSKYTINGRTSNFTEVQTLLKGRGIDLDHKRFLILQGEVESIAQMKPKAPSEHEDGLLEYLEDIIGTSKYKEPIEESLVELDKHAEERGEKLNRLRIVEREKNALEEKKREAEDFLRLQNDHVKALSRLYQWYLWKCLIADQDLSEKMERLEKDLTEETEKNKDDITHCQMLEDHYNERTKVYEEVKAAAIEASKDLAVHEKQQVNLEERKKHANSKGKKLKKSIQDDGYAKAEAQRAITSNTEKMEKERQKLSNFEVELDKEEKVLEGIRDSLKDKTQVFHDQIEQKQKELQPWTAKINTKQASLDNAVSERDMLQKKAEVAQQALEEAQEGLEQLRDEKKTKAKEFDTTQKHKTDLQSRVKAGEKKLQEMQKRVDDTRSKSIASRQKAEEAKASQQASTSQNKVLDSLMRLRSTGRISGFHGRLGNLGTIPEKYDVAISTACPALNNLIVDTVEQGQACIEYLRKQNVGRASLIALDKLSQTAGLDKIATPENVPRLFDLVQPKEPRFAPAFFKAIGNTLVANDLEQANRIAFGARRWRVVTLTGQLIDTSGTMAGGGNHVSRGAMSSKFAADAVQPEVIKRYEQDSEQAARDLEEMISEMRKFETQFDVLCKEVPQADTNLQKIELDIQTGAKRIADAEHRVKELQSQNKPDKSDSARISSLNKQIQADTQELEKLKDGANVIETAIQALEKKILEIGGAKLLSQKSRVDGIKLHINLAMDEITKAEVNRAKAEKDTLKFEKALEASTASLKDVETELQELQEQLEECTQYVDQLRTKVDAAQAAADNAKDDLEGLKAELDEKKEQIQQFRQKEMQIEQELNDVKKEFQENERILNHYREEHDKLKLEDVDDDEEDETAETEKKDEAEDAKDEETGEQSTKEKTAQARDHSHELHIYTVEELSRLKKKELLADVTYLEEKVKNATPNMAALKEYRRREDEFLKRAKDLEEVTRLRDQAKQKHDGLRKQRLDEFMTGFTAISSKLKEMYQMITLGGNAELELVDSMDPFSEGIIFSVMPPKKSWKNISNLSGGEKTLSSLALVFALHVFKPTPLYFMDEIDAALDFRNVSIVANYIKDRTKNAQFIIISLRNDMFELSHRLIGIYKTSNATRSISINNHTLNAVPVNNANTANKVRIKA